MEALSGSASLDDFVSKIEATDWAGCDARTFARAATTATAKLIALSKTEKHQHLPARRMRKARKPGWRASTTK